MVSQTAKVLHISRVSWSLYACLAKKGNNKNNTQSSENEFISLSFALRLRLGRYHVREEFLAFNGTVAVQELLREPLRRSEAALMRG
jgi:hypothetical protein